MVKTENGPHSVGRYNFLDETASGANAAAAAPGDSQEKIPDWQHDMLVLFIKNQIRVMPAMPILALLLAITSLQWIAYPLAVGWLVSAIICQGVQMYLCNLYFMRDRSHDEQRDWIGMLSASELLTGMCWCLPLFIFWDGATSMQHVYLIASIMAVIAVRLLIVNSFMPVLVAGTGVLTIGVALRCVSEAEPVYLARDYARHADLSRPERWPHRGLETGEGQGRGRKEARRGSQPRKVRLPRHHEP
jgi:two-component system, cell cycle sensor histidine kinase PleC